MTSLISGCASPLLAPGDLKHVCQVAVEEKFGASVFHKNVLSSAAGVPVSAAHGALKGLALGLAVFPAAPAAILTTPAGALFGVVRGVACSAASLEHPTADADFERILHAADAGILKRTLEADLNVPRPDCNNAGTAGLAKATPDTVVEIEGIDAGMGCLDGQQEYWISVQWRTISNQTGRVLNSTTTKCAQVSSRYVDDWFANPDRATAEIERALTGTGHRMAMELLAKDKLSECFQLQSHETGEAEAEAR
jgi:hypothetical protein